MAQKILFLDIETSPNLAYVWGAWKQNIGINQFIFNSNIICYAAKWYGHDRIFSRNGGRYDEYEMIEHLTGLLSAADIVVTHNGISFDLPVIRTRAAALGIKPFSPVRHVDTCRIAKRLFRFERNNLAFLAKYLGVALKDDHKEFPGFDLWRECMNMNPKAWDSMVAYNIQDVLTLEEVYEKMLPWMDDHPNVMVDNPIAPTCPKCGGDVQRRGYYSTNVNRYQRYRCNQCGGWSRSRYVEGNKEERRNILANAV